MFAKILDNHNTNKQSIGRANLARWHSPPYLLRKLGQLLIICLLCMISACGSQPASQAERPTYRIGYMICNSEQETLDRFIPFSAYLSRELGVNFETVAIDTINFTREVENLDFVHTNSLLYIILNRFHGVEVLTAEKKGSLGFRSQDQAGADQSTVQGDAAGAAVTGSATLLDTGEAEAVAKNRHQGLLGRAGELHHVAVDIGRYKNSRHQAPPAR